MTHIVPKTCPKDSQIGSLGDVLRTSWGPIFASWVMSCKNLKTSKITLKNVIF